MPRRSSSQSHRLVELFKDAERGTPAPSPAQSDPADSESTYLSTPAEEKTFDFAEYCLQCIASRMARANKSSRPLHGKRVAEMIYHHLQQGEELKAHILSAKEFDNQAPPIPSRAAYSERFSRLAVFGPAG